MSKREEIQMKSILVAVLEVFTIIAKYVFGGEETKQAGYSTICCCPDDEHNKDCPHHVDE
jgi:hypothetical protein